MPPVLGPIASPSTSSPRLALDGARAVLPATKQGSGAASARRLAAGFRQGTTFSSWRVLVLCPGPWEAACVLATRRPRRSVITSFSDRLQGRIEEFGSVRVFPAREGNGPARPMEKHPITCLNAGERRAPTDEKRTELCLLEPCLPYTCWVVGIPQPADLVSRAPLPIAPRSNHREVDPWSKHARPPPGTPSRAPRRPRAVGSACRTPSSASASSTRRISTGGCPRCSGPGAACSGTS